MSRPLQRTIPLLVVLVLAVVGLAISGYLTLVHYTASVPLVCASSGVINCEQVTTSPQSFLLGIPVAVLGMVYFLGMLALHAPWTWHRTDLLWRRTRLLAAVLGMGFVLYLVAAELLLIGAICLWCTGVHVTVFLIFVTTVFSSAAAAPSSSPTP